MERTVAAGIMTALIGFTSSFAVVLAGLRAVGATPAEAASGLVAVCLAQGLGMLWLTGRYRLPLTLAWSTPGAALLASTGAVAGGWAAAVGAFLVTGGLILLTGFWPRLGALIAAIPAPIAQAMLAGVLLALCVEPVRGLVDDRCWSRSASSRSAAWSTTRCWSRRSWSRGWCWCGWRRAGPCPSPSSWRWPG